LKYLCVHGHLSLPPRQDPFTGKFPREAGAAPFRNLYEQVTADCYRPNAVLGNLDLMSFDVAPTLCEWLEARDAATYSRILAADRGNAMATTFHHLILPLLSRRDKVTQILWGLRAFETHFGHQATGLWLPDMAVDQETLEVLIEHGIEFTLLSPEQVQGDLAVGAGPYYVRVSNEHRLTILVRNRELSDAISFQLSWLGGAGMFAARELAPRSADGLLLIATSGEAYGHYHAGEEMFLRYLLRQEAARAGYLVVLPAEFLRSHPPQMEVRLIGPTSWSCAHGVERWQRECGCAPLAVWKAPLRQAFLRLAQAADAIYEREACAAGLNPWLVRDDYADVLVKHVPGPAYLNGFADHALTRQVEERVLLLLEAQVHRMAMFDSYAFFGSELGALEVRSVIAHAAYTVSLIAQATGEDLSADLRRDLALAADARQEHTAAEIYAAIVETQSL